MGKPSGDLYEELLVLRARARDASALTELVQRWHGRLLAHASQLTRDLDGAEEVIQEVWMAVVQGIGKLNDPGLFGAWAYRIVGHKCADWIHRRARSRRDGNSDGLVNAPTKPDSASAPPADGLARAMDALSVEHREVLAFHYVQGMGVEQIAATLNIREGTVKSRLHYARQAMRQAMTKGIHE